MIGTLIETNERINAALEMYDKEASLNIPLFPFGCVLRVYAG